MMRYLFKILLVFESNETSSMINAEIEKNTEKDVVEFENNCEISDVVNSNLGFVSHAKHAIVCSLMSCMF